MPEVFSLYVLGDIFFLEQVNGSEPQGFFALDLREKKSKYQEQYKAI